MNPLEWHLLESLVTGAGAAAGRTTVLRGGELAEFYERRLRPLSPYSEIAHVLNPESGAWYLVQGDLVIDGHVAANTQMVIDGNLHVTGAYNDSRDGHLVVLGDLIAEHVLIGGALFVGGALSARGLIHGYYNDYCLEVRAAITARAFVMDQKGGEFDPDRVSADLYLGDYSGEGDVSAERLFSPELMVEPLTDFIDEARYDDETWVLPDFHAACAAVEANAPVFRHVPAGPELTDLLQRVLDGKSGKLDKLRGKDALVDRLIDIRIKGEASVPPKRLPAPEQAKAQVASDCPYERELIAKMDDGLGFDGYNALKSDPERSVRETCAKVLAEQATWRRIRTLTDEERVSLAMHLWQDPDPRVRREVIPALPVLQQEAIGRDWLAALRKDSAQEAEEDHNEDTLSWLEHLAWETSSMPLLEAMLDSGHSALVHAVARNLSIPPTMQRRIAAILPKAGVLQDPGATRPVKLFADPENIELAIAFLLDNSNLDAGLCLELAHQTVHLPFGSHIWSAWRDEVPMTAELLDLIRTRGDEELQCAWPELVMGCATATREQVVAAAQQLAEDDDKPKLAKAIEGLAIHSDVEFWDALADSKRYKLQSFAASNWATSHAALKRLVKVWKKKGKLTADIYSNPSWRISQEPTGLEAVGLPFHPNATDEQIEASIRTLLAKGDPYGSVKFAHKQLAARKLRWDRQAASDCRSDERS